MPTGKVKWFNNAKGYGFVLSKENGNSEDLFVHYSSIKMDGYKTLKAGQVVNYDVIQGPKGLHAVDISIVACDEANLIADASIEEKTPKLTTGEKSQKELINADDNIAV